jgi:hypothetical protein
MHEFQQHNLQSHFNLHCSPEVIALLLLQKEVKIIVKYRETSGYGRTSG